MTISRFALLSSLLMVCMMFMPAANAGLIVTKIGKSYVPNKARVPIQQPLGDSGGNTSVRDNSIKTLRWKYTASSPQNSGYFERNRDLGQVFQVGKKGFRLDAVILRTGHGGAAVLKNAPGAPVFLQIFKVSGTPSINDNGTPKGTTSKHGFTKNHRADDFVEGISFSSILVAEGGVFPNIPPTRGNSVTNDTAGRGVYMRWKLTGDDQVYLHANQRYAFLVGFEHPGNDYGFALAVTNDAANPAAAAFNNGYPGGFAIRREGNGDMSVTRVNSPTPPSNPALRQKLIDESMLPSGAARYNLMPGTNGYPDVTTYMDLQFYLEKVVSQAQH